MPRKIASKEHPLRQYSAEERMILRIEGCEQAVRELRSEVRTLKEAYPLFLQSVTQALSENVILPAFTRALQENIRLPKKLIKQVDK